MFKDILFQPPFARELILAAGGVLAVLTVVNYARARGQIGKTKRAVLAGMRLIVIGGLTLILLRPMALENKAAIDSTSVFSVLVDQSQSMNTCDKEEKSRIEEVAEALEDSESGFLGELNEFCEVQYFTFSEDIAPTTFAQLVQGKRAEGPKTDIATSLVNTAAASSNQRSLGILLISDGRENEGGDAASAANYLKSLNVPVWTTTFGSEQQSKDVFVSARVNQNFLFTGQEAQMKIDVSHAGYADWYAKVDVQREGASVGVQQIKLNKSCEQLTVPIKEDVRGTYKYTVKVEPLRGEADIANNERTVFVRVVDEKSRVLLLEAEPYWDTKFLLRALQADPNLDVTAIFCVSSKRAKTLAVAQSSAGPADPEPIGTSRVRLPRTKEELAQYDCIILGRGVDRIFSAEELALFKSYLEERGGSIIFARGKATAWKQRESEEGDILGQLEPVEWDPGGLARARLELTAAGTVNPMFNLDQARSAGAIIRELPELVSVARVKEEKTLAVILAKGKSTQSLEEMATVTYHRFGKGKVLSIGATGLWRWAFMPEQFADYDEVYGRFWGQLIRWLVFGSDFLPGQEITFRSDRFSYDLGEAVPLVIRTRQVDPNAYAPRIELTTPKEEVVNLTPAKDEEAPEFYTTTYLPREEGEYKAVLYNNVGSPEQETVRFAVYADSVETRIVSSNQELMAQVADITSGKVLPITEWDSLPGLIKDFEAATRQEATADDIWDRVLVFLALMALLAIEWFARRKAGLV